MASLKAIRRRIASTKSTQQITRAMKLVSAARLRRAQEALLNARPYSDALARITDSLFVSEAAMGGAREGAPKRSLCAVISSDRGLCGGYNANLLRAAEDVRRDSQASGIELQLYVVGKKAFDYFTRANVQLAESAINNTPRLATVELARRIASRMLADYRSGAISEATIVYTQFKSVLTQRPMFERLLPVAAPGARAEGESAQLPTEYVVEPSRDELAPVIMRTYLESAIFHALLEAEASEQGARMSAMDNATNNAIEMINRYTIEMNRARQAQITKELMDIVGGAEALTGGRG
ncbi:MAG TPA: ATP synthase F1 subunit gamma [Candidatus Binataceae bacterium]|nr:ATP synthase F1 subunit gamma [Candidatus Binataceae bacterium]